LSQKVRLLTERHDAHRRAIGGSATVAMSASPTVLSSYKGYAEQVASLYTGMDLRASF